MILDKSFLLHVEFFIFVVIKTVMWLLGLGLAIHEGLISPTNTVRLYAVQLICLQYTKFADGR